MRTIVNLLSHPMTWLVIGFFVLWFFSRKTKPIARRMAIFIYGFLSYFLMTPILPLLLISPLEDAYAPLIPGKLDTSKAYHIIVLGAGVGYDERLPATSLLENVMLGRLVEGIRVHKLLPRSKLVTSGYSSIGRKPQGEVAREAAIILGVDPSLVFAQGQPSNTYEEALQYVKDWGTRTPLIIATSAMHQRRAVYLFQKAGVSQVIAAPTNYRFKKDNPRTFSWFIKPAFSNMNDVKVALHERIGLAYAKFFY